MHTSKSRAPRLAPLALLAGACHVGPEYEPPALERRTEPAWRVPAGPEVTRERSDLALWWRRLESPELDALAARLLAQNLSLAEARQRVVAARALIGVADSARSLRLDGDVGYVRAGTGEDSLNFAGPPPGQDVDVYSVGVAAGWEIDLWGRVARLVEAADADLDVAVEDYRDAAVSLLAELALAYVDAHTLHGRLELLQREVGLREETLRLAQSRADAGTGTRLDVEELRREVRLLRAREPELRRALRAAENRVALLVGERPADGLVAAGDEPSLPERVGLGLPADLLTRRADVRRAERALAAAVARIGAAEAERYPRISLTGTLALRAMDLDTLVGGADALSYSIGPSLVFPLLEGGRIESQVRLREARAESARLAFERALLEALGEVETAAEGLVRTRERVDRLELAASSARTAVELARELYESGTRSLLPLLDAQRSQVGIEEDLLLARQAALVQTIDLYRALGGGWEPIALDGTLEDVARASREESGS